MDIDGRDSAMNYRFDLSTFTIGDAMNVQYNAQRGDVYGVLLIANRFIPINLFALPMAEINTVLTDFMIATQNMRAAADPIDQMIQRALED